MRRHFKWFFVGLCVSISAVVLARMEPWDVLNDPARFDSTYIRAYSELPKIGVVSKKPWSDSYWPSARGRLTWRWYNPASANTPNESSAATYYNQVYDYRELLSMTEEQIAKLSPIEKFDIYLGNIYPNREGYYKWFLNERAEAFSTGIGREKTSTVTRVNSQTGRREQVSGDFSFDSSGRLVRRGDVSYGAVANWAGLCHGWAVASILEPEPINVIANVSVNDLRDGTTKNIKVNFTSADIKALLSLFYAKAQEQIPVRMIGTRCKQAYVEYVSGGKKYVSIPQNRECLDTNAGAFHIALTNEVGIKRRGFVADIATDYQVWNHPVTSYRVTELGSRKPSRGAAKEAVQEIVVNTQIDYMVEMNPYPNSLKEWDWENLRKSSVYQYAVELDRNGQIVGGSWISGDRPDFMWVMDKQSYSGDFAALKKLVIPAQ